MAFLYGPTKEPPMGQARRGFLFCLFPSLPHPGVPLAEPAQLVAAGLPGHPLQSQVQKGQVLLVPPVYRDGGGGGLKGHRLGEKLAFYLGDLLQ